MAAASIRSTTWSAIRRERFACAPDGIFDDLVTAAENVAERRQTDRARAVAAARRNRKLRPFDEGTDKEVQGPGGAADWTELREPAAPCTKDPRVDPDRFTQTSGRKPHHYEKAVALASDVHLNHMRFLLEMHYDAVHAQRYHSKARKDGTPKHRRTSKYKLYEKFGSKHFAGRFEQLELPESVKAALTKTDDECNLET